jgi:DNA-binding NtrC family response regulator
MEMVSPETGRRVGGQNRQAHIMLVDDDPSLRSALRTLLEISGYSVSAFGDGHQAVHFFQERSRSIELVLLDMIMPRISGEQVFHELKRTDPEVKVLFISGYCEGKTIRDLLANDHTGFLQKPFTMAKLLETMSGILVPRAISVC